VLSCRPLVLHRRTGRPSFGNATICLLRFRLIIEVESMVHEVFHAMGLIHIHVCCSPLAFPYILFSVLYACIIHVKMKVYCRTLRSRLFVVVCVAHVASLLLLSVWLMLRPCCCCLCGSCCVLVVVVCVAHVASLLLLSVWLMLRPCCCCLCGTCCVLVVVVVCVAHVASLPMPHAYEARSLPLHI
jgi:hypothetical protein